VITENLSVSLYTLVPPKTTRTMSHSRHPQHPQPHQQYWGTDLSKAFPYSDHASSSIYSNGSCEHQPRPTLSAEEMHKRRRYRDTVLNETSSHLLVHPHNSMMDTGRNILHVLHDRERRGSSAVTSVALWRRSRAVVVRGHVCDAAASNSVSSQATKRAKNSSKIGYQSPSTVLESPLQRANRHGTAAEAAATTTSTDDVTVVAANLYSPDNNDLNDSMDEVNDDQHSVDDSSEKSVAMTLPTTDRRVTYPLTIGREIQAFGEYCAATKYHSAFLTHLGGDDPLDAHGNRPASSRAVSTISVAFSPDGLTMASTHGDHTVKLSCCSTGRLLQTLDGHPRTPWTVKYHPTDSRIVASGCLGQQVRVWNWKTKSCLQMIRLEFAIISLSFHPSGTVLAIANGTRLHLWGVDDVEPESSIPQEQASQNHPLAHNARTSAPASSRGDLTNMNEHQSPQAPSLRRAARLTEWDQRHMLRCVHFPPNGTTLIIGGVNPDEARRSGGSRQRPGGGVANGPMSFYLRLWDFDLERALDPDGDTTANLAASPISISMARRSISNVRCSAIRLMHLTSLFLLSLEHSL
jgi:activating molecule in BECN1-regulated autophagy protein 1